MRNDNRSVIVFWIYVVASSTLLIVRFILNKLHLFIPENQSYYLFAGSISFVICFIILRKSNKEKTLINMADFKKNFVSILASIVFFWFGLFAWIDFFF